MNPGTETTRADGRERLTGRLLIAGAVLCLTGVGGVLWLRHGAAVFTDMVSAALAGCF